MDKKVFAVIVAGGSGSRMGSDIPKQFLSLDGKPILQRTVESIHSAVPGVTIITVLPKAHFETWKNLCAVNNLNIPQVLVEGGITRFHSVRNALDRVPSDAIVMVHDGVRPLISAGLIDRLLESAQTNPAVIPSLPVVDTIKSLDQTLPDPDRSKIVAVQTPQVFHSEVLKQAYTQAYDISFTDDGSVVKKQNIPLTFVEGERYNIKITTPEDLELAQMLLLKSLTQT